jgi:HK97 gp10 family phage protein
VAKAGGGVLVTGDKALDRVLRGMPVKLQKKLSRKATRKAAKDIILPDAKNRVPVDFGELEESLTVTAIKRSRYKFGHQVGTKEGHFRGDQFYGAFLEFGTKERFHKPKGDAKSSSIDTHKGQGKYVGSIEPYKFTFLRPALYDNSDQVRDAYVEAMKEFIRESGSAPAKIRLWLGS